jgi:hypothetical protein
MSFRISAALGAVVSAAALPASADVTISSPERCGTEVGLPSGFDPAVWGHNHKINTGLPYLLAQPPQ